MTDPQTVHVRKAITTLHRYPVAYHDLYQHLLTDRPFPASAGGQRTGTTRTGKPVSKPPGGMDHAARAAAIRSVQHLDAAFRTLEAWDWPSPLWSHPVAKEDATDWLVELPHPDDMFEPAAQLRGLLTDVDDPDLAEDDAKVVEVTCRCVSRARGQIVSVGLWERPLREPPPCTNTPCTAKRRPGGKECEACARHRQRTGRARIVVDQGEMTA